MDFTWAARASSFSLSACACSWDLSFSTSSFCDLSSLLIRARSNVRFLFQNVVLTVKRNVFLGSFNLKSGENVDTADKKVKSPAPPGGNRLRVILLGEAMVESRISGL